MSVGHGPIIFIWKAGNATRKRETDNKKNLLPNRGKTQKSITEGREIRTPREREREPLLMVLVELCIEIA